ncbi:alpha-amylase family glycosyl hydrolase [Nonlabens xiamenensis]|uniref:alpha-amylase family glycosyl hydrolase n=1 Tax=Nonlabens xiamenensis TaxID=2341043 RepID=UPI000F6158C4|nr:alpha-amylase family glycosyl hydrolase [Nonlabens xiamenensis]
MKNFILAVLALCGIAFAKAQVTTSPSTPTQTDQVVLTFDSTGTDLENVSGTLYAYTGVTVNGNRWQNIVNGPFNDNTTAPAFTNVGGNIYQLDLGTTVEQFYGVAPGDVVSEICLVIRNSSATAQTNPDIFLDIFPPGLNVAITSPQDGDIFNINDSVTISGDCSQNTALNISVNGNAVATATAMNISTNYSFNASGNYEIVVSANNGTDTASDSIDVFVPGVTQNVPRPAGLKHGVNENADGSVTFLLAAPLKNDVVLVGSFTNWNLDTAYQMNKDGDYFWITVPASEFTANTEFMYQYLVDFEIKVADPYSQLILDENSDPFIKPGNYPNLPAYPTGETEGDITLYTYQKTPYNWTVNNFVRPDQENLVVYELLVRDFSEEDSYQQVIDRIDYLDDLGVNAIEFMPINEFEGTDSWGYNPKLHGAIDKAYGTPEKFKELVDLCHSKGIAVIIDVVYNHAFSQSPLCQMWWDAANFRPAADNPYMNPVAKHDFNVGYDMNHESPWTREYVKQTLQFLIDEYKVDGFRFDLSKGFTQNNTLGNVGAWNAYDQSRVDILNDYRSTIWNNNSNDIYMILEHLAVDSEEKVLADVGFMLWGKMTDAYNQNSMGYSTNADVFRTYFTSRNYNDQHLVAYAESHDEQRLMYKNLQFGNNVNPAHDVRSLPVALDRQEAIAAILYSIPGPKMLWQFGELGYEIDIDFNGRTGRKPIPWTLNYDTDQDRLDLYEATATMINFKTLYPDTFNSRNNSLDVSGLVKRINLNGSQFDAVVVANFATSTQTVDPNFSQTGVWYDYFGNNSVVNVTNTSSPISLQPGEYKLYTTQALNDPLSTDDAIGGNNALDIRLYPNPTADVFRLSQPVDQIILFNSAGQKIKSYSAEGTSFSTNGLSSGLYFLQVTDKDRVQTLKLIKE